MDDHIIIMWSSSTFNANRFQRYGPYDTTAILFLPTCRHPKFKMNQLWKCFTLGSTETSAENEYHHQFQQPQTICENTMDF